MRLLKDWSANTAAREIESDKRRYQGVLRPICSDRYSLLPLGSYVDLPPTLYY